MRSRRFPVGLALLVIALLMTAYTSRTGTALYRKWRQEEEERLSKELANDRSAPSRHLRISLTATRGIVDLAAASIRSNIVNALPLSQAGRRARGLGERQHI